ncbi:unnamed protein product, partial [Mesorhabditis spiculigera]
MGNSLSATTQAEIMPVEAYVADIVEPGSDIESLGSTRFMKVARGRTSEGLRVLKVFVFPANLDLSMLDVDCAAIISIKERLADAANCCAFQRVLKRNRYAVGIRHFHRYSLFDRLSTRPFVVETERLWYMYQLFKALVQCEERNVCHGDIKSQNILLSSSNWLQLADFASFKPTYLPLDNPSNYTYFFDTSRRQTCCMAPERLMSPVSPALRPLLRILLAQQPSLRPSAQIILAEFSHLFPSIFGDFIYNYLNIFRQKEVHAATVETEASVRGRAIHSITQLLAAVEPQTHEEAATFMEYLLPKYDAIANETRTDSMAHMALAVCLGRIAETAHRYMIASRSLQSTAVDDEVSGAEPANEGTRHEKEATALFKAISGIFVHLCARGNEIKQCLVDRESLQKLHRFAVAVQGADQGFPLDHMVTFFNIREDWRLRAVFFDSLPHCVFNKKNVEALRSLFEQGIIEFEEMVVVKAINCIVHLTRVDLLEKETVNELFPRLAPFLAHPNDWIRAGVVDLIVVLNTKLTLPEMHWRVVPKIEEYLTRKLVKLNNKKAILSHLKEPIPRQVWAQIMDFDENRMKLFCETLETMSLQKIVGPPKTARLEGGIRRIVDSLADNETRLKFLANFRSIFPKLAESKAASSMQTTVTHNNGVVDLTSDAFTRVAKYEHVLGDNSQVIVDPKRSELLHPDAAQMSTSNSQIMRTSACGAALRELLVHKNDEFRKTTGRPRPGLNAREWHTAPNQGKQVAHLHEHTARVTALSLNPAGDRFASTSADGTIKIWNVDKYSGTGPVAPKSEGTCVYSKAHAITDAGWACDGQLLCFATCEPENDRSQGRLFWADVSGGSVIKVSGKVDFDSTVGAPSQIFAQGQLAHVRTHHGYFFLFDYRLPKESSLGRHVVWRRQFSANHGLATSFAVDPARENWMVVSGTNSVLSLWDLRYPLEVASFPTQEKKIALGLWAMPERMRRETNSANSTEVFAAYVGRSCVDSYEIHSGTRKRVLWPSLKEVHNYESGGRDLDDDRLALTTAMTFASGSGFVYSGDSLGALRRWNLSNASGCEYLSGPYRPSGEFVRQRIAYDSKIVGEEERYFEKALPVDRQSIDRVHSPLDTKVTLSHRTSITTLCTLPHNLLASADHDGIIKIWK